MAASTSPATGARAAPTGPWTIPVPTAISRRPCDDFHGTDEWDVFVASMEKIFPDRPIVEIPNADPIFHTVYDLDDRYQVPGAQYMDSGKTYEKDGRIPHWRAIYDDRGRVMVAMCFNMDLGDSWEHADNPEYPQRFSALGIRIGVDYLIYAFTH